MVLKTHAGQRNASRIDLKASYLGLFSTRRARTESGDRKAKSAAARY